jgi:hypothetical protein
LIISKSGSYKTRPEGGGKKKIMLMKRRRLRLIDIPQRIHEIKNRK